MHRLRALDKDVAIAARTMTVSRISAPLILLAAVGLLLHLFQISSPTSPVFDEAHFATYSADYVAGIPFEDIHPPFGKWIYASVLKLYPPSAIQGATFVAAIRMADGLLHMETPKSSYGNFPYVALRIVDSVFGVLLALALYFFMRSLDIGRVGSVLAAFFVTLDNAILLNTRLILLDGMFLFFGIAALALYFGFGSAKRRLVILAGIVWGLSLSVKLTGIVFLGPGIAAILLLAMQSGDWKRELKIFAKFALAGFAVLAGIWFAGTLFFSPSARLNALAQLDPRYIPSLEWQAEHPIESYFVADALELRFSASNYTTGPATYDNSSPWYLWPIDQSPMHLGWYLVLEGNPVLWFASTIAVLLALGFFCMFLFRYFKKKKDTAGHAIGHLLEKYRAPGVLLGGYLFAMLPFVTIIHRDTFLYHYFPALLFAFGLLAWFISEWLGVREWGDFTQRTAGILCIVIALVIAGFLIMMPGTYGFM
jgi:dolichyl-phosphate-mannose-protein mannosyltransferase